MSTYTVGSLSDTGAGSGLAGDLRYCVTHATSGNDTIAFGVTGTIRLGSALPALSTSVAIQGPGADLLTVQGEFGSSFSHVVTVGSAATVQLAGLTIANGSDGAIKNHGTLTINSSVLTGNNAQGFGGAIYNDGTLTINSSTLANNGASGGGAIYTTGTLTISNSTLANNAAVGGVAYYWDAPYYPYYAIVGEDAYGGAVYVASGTTSIDHSTLADNRAIGCDGAPGDPGNYPGAGYGWDVANASDLGALRIGNTIVANLYGSATSLGHNLVDVDPRLGPLQDNGGPTPTMALLAGSPAINAGDGAGALAYDQRGPGFPRIFGGAVDIGAIELQSPAPPAVFITDVSRPEGNLGTAAALFTLGLSSATTETVTVQYSTADGTAAVSDGDYEAASGTLTFAPGQTSKIIAVVIDGDRRPETDETFLVNLGEATNATIADGQAVGTIVDEEPGIFIDTAPVGHPEGNAGTTPFTFTVRLTFAYDVPVTVDFAAAGGSAAAGSDYQATAGTLTFATGETTKTITVLANGDRSAEPTESFFVNLSGGTYANIVSSQGAGLIFDDEPRVSIGDVSKKEGKKGQTTQFTFTVMLSAAYDQTVTMSFQTVNGTAKASDNDYVAKTGTLTFAPGETTKTITIEVKGDRKREADETFYLDLFGLSDNALFTKNRGTATILNDD